MSLLIAARVAFDACVILCIIANCVYGIMLFQCVCARVREELRMQRMVQRNPSSSWAWTYMRREGWARGILAIAHEAIAVGFCLTAEYWL